MTRKQQANIADKTIRGERPTGRSSVWLHRYAVITAAATFVLLLAGALVVGTRSSLSVPDWPLSFGQIMPEMTGGVFYEHGHRLVAALVGLLTTILAIWIWRAEPRAWIRRLGFVALLAVILQGVLGGITVRYLLPAPISIGHACLAQIFFLIVLTLAFVTSPYWETPLAELRESGGLPLRHLCAAATSALLLQLITGAALRHRVFGIVPHLATAALVCFLTGWVVWRTMHLAEQRPFQQLAVVLGVLLIAQVTLGLGSYFAREAHAGSAPVAEVVWLTSAHLITGALLLGCSWITALLAFRRSAVTMAGRSFSGASNHAVPQGVQNTLA